MTKRGKRPRNQEMDVASIQPWTQPSEMRYEKLRKRGPIFLENTLRSPKLKRSSRSRMPSSRRSRKSTCSSELLLPKQVLSGQSIESEYGQDGQTATSDLRLRFLETISVLDWSRLHSQSAHKHARNGSLAKHHLKPVSLAEAVDLMQQLTMRGFTTVGSSERMDRKVSTAKYFSHIFRQRLSAAVLLASAIRNYWFDNLELRVGESYLHVDRYIFCHYIKVFEDNTSSFLQLPEHVVDMKKLSKMYDWIVSDAHQIDLGEDFLPMYVMAKLLNVRCVLEQYWHLFSSSGNVAFDHEKAFQAYVPARELGCHDLMMIFMKRIQKCFLPLVASAEFLGLTASELICLFSSDMLHVNSEDEIFYAAIRWLEFDWRFREVYLVEVMRAVRFLHISPWLLYSIANKPENKLIARVGKNQAVIAMIWQSFLSRQEFLALEKNPQYVNKLPDELRLTTAVQRYWSFCKGVPHHHGGPCPRFRKLNYKSFQRLLITLHSNSNIFIDNLTLIPFERRYNYVCCKLANRKHKRTKISTKLI